MCVKVMVGCGVSGMGLLLSGGSRFEDQTGKSAISGCLTVRGFSRINYACLICDGIRDVGKMMNLFKLFTE